MKFCIFILFSSAIARDLFEDTLVGSRARDPFASASTDAFNDIISKLGDTKALVDFQNIVEQEISNVLAGLSEEINMMKDLLSGKGSGKQLMDLLVGGNGNPLDFMKTLASGDTGNGNVLNMFSPTRAMPSVEKEDCLKKSLKEKRYIFGGFLNNLPTTTGDQLFGDLDLCEKKEKKDVWKEMGKFLNKPPKDILGALSKETRKNCRKGLRIEKANCRQMQKSMCSLLGGEKGLKPENIFDQMKSLASRGAKSAAAEKNCENIENILKEKDPKQFGKVLSRGGQDLIFGNVISSFVDRMGGGRKRK